MITQKRLKELVTYDPATGIFRWIRLVGKKGKVGKKVGSKHSGGYLEAQIDNHRNFLHRFAWLYMTGKWPDDQIDHKNTIRSDNRWSNLRKASCQHNSANGVRRKTNTSGFKGVYFNKKNKSWIANIHLDYKTRYLGSFSSKEEAHAAYFEAAIAANGEFSRAA